MKQTLLLILALLPLQASFSHDKKWNELIEPRVDYTYEYSWSVPESEWVYQGEWINRYVYDYRYEDDLLMEMTKKDIETGEFTSRELFIYDDKQALVKHLFQVFESGSWQDERQDLIGNNDLLQIEEIIVQYWINGTWVNNRRQYNYQYNELGLNSSYMRQHWVSEKWIDKTFTIRYYDADSLLTERIVSNVSNAYKFRFEYHYDVYKNCINLIYQESSGENWDNTWQEFYTYNSCGQKYKKIRQIWAGSDWLNQSKWISYFTIDIDPKDKFVKIPVCHKGRHTIYIPYPALKAHLKHGDCFGPCQSDKICGDCKQKTDSEDPKPSHSKNDLKSSLGNFHSGECTVYPNPLKDKATIKLGDAGIRQIDLLNSHGSVLRTYIIKNQGDIILERDGLTKGIYFLRLISDKVKIKKIIII